MPSPPTSPNSPDADNERPSNVDLPPAALIDPSDRPTPPSHGERLALYVVRKLRDAGYEALWAGGCVRDLLLGRVPTDFDVATSATPDQVRRLFGKRRTLPIGAAFGVVIVLGKRGENPVEVATFRNDGQYSDGRHPDAVTFSTAEEDAKRRDFTMNGLFYDPLTHEIFDYVGGRQDLKQRIVRAIGNPAERFQEDKLRMLRAIRFAATFEFALDEATADAIRQRATDIGQVSSERIGGELRRMLTHAQRRRAVELLDATGLLPAILPELPQLQSQSKSLRPSSEGLHVLALLDPDTTFVTAVAALLASLIPIGTDVPVSVVPLLRDAWRLTNHESGRLAWLLETVPLAQRANSVPWPQLQRVLIHEGRDELLDWLAAQVMAGHVAQEHLDAFRHGLALPTEKLNPPPLITGEDLVRHGVPRGPVYRVLLDQLRDAQLLGDINDRAAALRWVDEYLANHLGDDRSPSGSA